MTTNKKLPFEAVNRAALNALPRVLDWAGVRWQVSRHEYQMLNPNRADDESFGSFSVNSKTGVWKDFATGDAGGDVVSLVAYLKGWPQGESCKELAKLFGILDGEALPDSAPAAAPSAKAPDAVPVLPIPPELLGRMPKGKAKHPGKVAQVWRYNDAAGLPLLFVVRLEPGANGRSKDYYPLTVWQDVATDKREWRWKNLPTPRPLYGLDRLAVRPDAPVVICEGEKAADAAAKLLPNHVAICWPNGAEAVGAADFTPLAGRYCLIWPDHDQPGQAAAEAVSKVLHKVGASAVACVAVETFQRLGAGVQDGKPVLIDGGELNEGDDAFDLSARGWTAEHFALLEAQGGWIVGTGLPEPEPDAGTSDTSKAPETAMPAPASQKTGKASSKAPKRPSAGGAGAGPFKLTEAGIWYQTEDMDTPMWVCSPLEIIARTRDKTGDNWGLLVHFTDPDRTAKDWNIPAEMLASSDGTEAVKGLVSRGLRLGAGPKARQRLLEYLCRYDGHDRATIVGRLGWHGEAFLLPDGQLGTAAESLVFQASGKQQEVMQAAGSLADWQSEVGRYCVGNSRLAFAVSVALAAPLLDVIGAESGGFHFFGDSSQGKTTLLQVAASVFGSPGYLQTWRATDNALEAMAAAYSDCLLPLDEIHQCDPRIVGETIYMLGNGRGKTRANDRGGSRAAVAEWRLLFLSSGEKTLAAHMAEARKDMKAGMEIRMLAVQADAGQSQGLFETVHDMISPKALADHLKQAVGRQYGTPARAFIERLVSERGMLAGVIRRQMTAFADELLPSSAHGQVFRAASRFALVAVAGELASAWGITGWPRGTAMTAAKVCFADWLKARGTTGNREDEDMLAKVRLFFEQNGESRFTRLSAEAVLHEDDGQTTDPDEHAPKTIGRCGYRVKDKVSSLIKYYILAESFRTEVCAGMDVGRVCKLLAKIGALEVTKGCGHMLQTRLTPEAKYSKSGRAKVYCVTSNLFDSGQTPAANDEGLDDAA